MAKIDTVVFDMDGTLMDTLDDLTSSMNYVMRKYSYPEYTRPEICSFVGNGLANLMECCIPEGRANANFDVVFADFKEYYGAHCNEKTGPYPHIIELLGELKSRGYKMAIVSNKAHGPLCDLVKLHFSQWIDVAIGEREGVNKKPAPDTVYLALEALGSAKENAVYVGDSEVDVATAKNSGLPCVGCEWGFRTRELLEGLGADVVISDPLELVGVLEGM